METLKVEKSQVQTIYSKATPQEKSLLESLFGKDVISQSITDRVKTFEDACGIAGKDSLDLKFNDTQEYTPDEIAYSKLKVVIAALNEGWIPNWKDVDEEKWYCWFYMDKMKYSPSGFGLSVVIYNRTYSIVGSRLCFKSEELAKYAATQFVDLYKAFLV